MKISDLPNVGQLTNSHQLSFELTKALSFLENMAERSASSHEQAEKLARALEFAAKHARKVAKYNKEKFSPKD